MAAANAVVSCAVRVGALSAQQLTTLKGEVQTRLFNGNRRATYTYQHVERREHAPLARVWCRFGEADCDRGYGMVPCVWQGPVLYPGLVFLHHPMNILWETNDLRLAGLESNVNRFNMAPAGSNRAAFIENPLVCSVRFAVLEGRKEVITFGRLDVDSWVTDVPFFETGKPMLTLETFNACKQHAEALGGVVVTLNPGKLFCWNVVTVVA